MKDISKIMPDFKVYAKENVEQLFIDIIKKEYPELKDYKVSYDLTKQVVQFEGLTPDQEVRIHKLATESH